MGAKSKKKPDKPQPAAPTPYRSTAAAPWSDAKRTQDGDLVTLTGTCGVCGHPVTIQGEPVVRAYLVLAREARGGPSMDAWPTPDVVLICDCGQDHPGRAAEDRGCGAFWFAGDGR